MNELVRSAGNLVARAGSGRRPGASTASADFTQSYTFDWSALPASIRSTVPDASAEVAACDLDDHDRTVRRRRDTGEYWQPLTVWRATRSGITLLHLRRVLDMLGPKRFASSGAERLDRGEFHAAVADPSVRRGIVKDQGARTTSRAAGEPGEAATANGDFLPSAVRAEFESLVPSPTFEHSVLVQYSSAAGLPIRHHLRLLRMDGSAAAVVVAKREAELLPTGCSVSEAQRIVSLRPWDVTRYSYRLAPGERLPLEGPGLPGGQTPTTPQLR